jgi:hypothetical protein
MRRHRTTLAVAMTGMRIRRMIQIGPVLGRHSIVDLVWLGLVELPNLHRLILQQLRCRDGPAGRRVEGGAGGRWMRRWTII